MDKKILFLYSRDVEINDSGASKTMILLIQYLSRNGYECHCLFKIKNDSNYNIFYHEKGGNEKDSIRKVVIENDIHIVLAPEARLYASILSTSLKGLNCKIITALHSKPGYDRLRLHILLCESLKYNQKILGKIRAFFLLLIYPIFYIIYILRDYIVFRNAYKKSDYLILLSESYINEFSSIYHVSKDKLRAIGNPVSFNIYADDRIIDNKEKKVLIVARFEERSKRILVALKAWKLVQDRFPDWTFEIVGFGRSLPLYQEFIQKNRLTRVFFKGRQVPLIYYKSASLFLMTSAYEGWPMTLVESMQMGCVPVVMDSYSALHSIIEDRINGYIVTDGDIEAFANIMADLMTNELKCKTMAKQAVIKSHTWEPDKICSRYKDLLDSIIELYV